MAVITKVVGESIDQIWTLSARALSEAVRQESRAGRTKEVLGFQAVMLNPALNLLSNPLRKASPIYAAGELLWYLSGKADGKMIRYYAPSYKRFLERDGTAWGGYGRRIRGLWGDQLSAVIDHLREDEDTRQAVIGLWNGELDLVIPQTQHGERPKDIPCTLSLQFLMREGNLHCVATMRSNDWWLGMPYDVFCFTTLQRYIAERLGAELGIYYHNVGSFHAYERNWKELDELEDTPVSSGWLTSEGPALLSVRDELSDAAIDELALRSTPWSIRPEQKRTLLSRVLYLASLQSRRMGMDDQEIDCPHVRAAIQRRWAQ